MFEIVVHPEQGGIITIQCPPEIIAALEAYPYRIEAMRMLAAQFISSVFGLTLLPPELAAIAGPLLMQKIAEASEITAAMIQPPQKTH